MKVIIEVEDVPGFVKVKAFIKPSVSEEENGIAMSPATELGDFLMRAAEVWQATQNMEMPEVVKFIESVTHTQTIN